jgi:4-pyridoxolactonase
MRVWLLDTGTLRMDRSQVMWNAPGGELLEIPTGGVLIEHDAGLILADTGMDVAHARKHLAFMQPEQTSGQTISAQLELCGFRPSDVDTLVNSHLHFDHAGANRQFPGARVIVHERELAQAREPAPFERLAYSDRGWDHESARLEPFAGDYEVVSGVRLFETPGHSAGHCSLLVEARAGGGRGMLFGFDVAYTQKALERELQPTFHLDPVAGQRSISRLKEIAQEHDADVLLCHDAGAWTRFRRAPEFYEL